MSKNAYTGVDWEEVRLAMHSSLMVNIKISALAENLGMSWPYSGSDETPTKYIDLNWRQLQEHPTFLNRPERTQSLIEILKETLAFDDPFGEMVDQAETAVLKEDELTKVLNKLEIPANYPLRLTSLTNETKDFCTKEKLETVGNFIDFSQRMAKNIVIGGDFRSFLNALSNVDEVSIAGFLPYRKGAKGLHVVEAVGLAVRMCSKNEQLALAKRYGARLSSQQESDAARPSGAAVDQAEKDIENRILDFISFFDSEVKAFTARHNKGENLEREFIVLGDQVVEKVSLKAFIGVIDPKSKEGGKGFFGAFSRLFKRG